MTQIMACQMRQRLPQGGCYSKHGLQSREEREMCPWVAWGSGDFALKLQLQTFAFTLRLYGSQALLGWVGAQVEAGTHTQAAL